MPLPSVWRTGASTAAIFLTLVFPTPRVAAQAQQDAAPAETRASTGMAPRAMPTDYQAQAKAGKVTIGAEFAGHSVPTPEGPLSTEDYVVVEVGFFGTPGADLQLSLNDFSLKMNGKKAVPQISPLMVLKSLKDPSWVPPNASETKSKTSIGGGGDQGNDPPAPIKMPVKMQLANEKRTQKASMPEGTRPLPQAGLLFFPHAGKLRSAELVYNGAAGKATLTLSAY